MGILRFLLAVLVAYSHWPFWNENQVNFAVSAVVAFFFLSGYLMAGSYSRFSILRWPTISFYIDRFYRIYPAFILIFLFTIFFKEYSDLHSNKLTTVGFIGEILIFIGCFEANSWAALLSGLGMVLGIGYSL